MIKLRGKSLLVCAYVDCNCLSFYVGAPDRSGYFFNLHCFRQAWGVYSQVVFSSVLLGRPVDVMHDLEVAISFAESGVLLPVRSGVHTFVSDVRLFSVLTGDQSDYWQAYLAYHWSFDVD